MLLRQRTIKYTYAQTIQIYTNNMKEGIVMGDIKFEIIKQIAVLSEGSKGWTKEVNLISWNDKPPKYDIREWSPDHTKMGKGITLSEEELKKLKEIEL